MTQATITKKLNKTAEEMNEIIKKSQRKLLELEVMLSMAEVKAGKVKVFKRVDDFFKHLK